MRPSPRWIAIAVPGLVACATATLGPPTHPAADSGTGPVVVSRHDAAMQVAIDAGPPPPQLPLELRCGRTYDQETDYFTSSGTSREVMTHRDGTGLPLSDWTPACAPSGCLCGSGCSEEVTRIEAGGYMRATFEDATLIEVQSAFELGAGTLVMEASCGGGAVASSSRDSGRSTTPGYTDLGWQVPTAESCEITARAQGGFVHVRAFTVTCRTQTAPPTVDLRVNGSDGPVVASSPADLALHWYSRTATSGCTAQGAWHGGRDAGGDETLPGVPQGTYEYTITCSNEAGSASDSVTVTLADPPI